MFLLLLFLGAAHCSVNLFISKEETSRTLGTNGELTYVEDGTINQYSSKFPYRVEANVSQLKFTWSATDKVEYSMNVESDDVAVLPVLRVARAGNVPRHTSEFSVEYRCAGSKAGQFQITLHINFTLSNGETRKLRLRQEKLCSARDGRRIVGGHDSDASRMEDLDAEASNAHIMYAIVGIAALFLVLIALVLLAYFSSSAKKTGSAAATAIRSRLPTSFRSTRASSQRLFLTSTPNKSMSTLSTRLRPSTSASTESAPVAKTLPPVDVKRALVELYADRNLFSMLPFDELQGTFGEMKWAIWRQTATGMSGDIDEDEDEGTGDEAVLVKSLKANANQQQVEKFLSEALVFHRVPPHTNLAQICAAASYGHFDRPETVTDLPLLCYRHQGFGNLKKFLLSCRTENGTLRRKDNSAACGQTLNTHELVWMGLQVVRAVAHLHTYSIVHCDIATRNCIVSELKGNRSPDRLHVQLCDNALSKDLFPGDYHCLGDNENRPLFWMAPESITSNTYTPSSDMWSYGVTLWELLTCASSPNVNVAAEDIPDAIQQGVRPPQPYGCPDQLYSLMQSCWHVHPRERPSAPQTVQQLQSFIKELSQFL